MTRNATIDELTDSDYREMYDELKAGKGLQPFVKMIGSIYSKAQWSKYERGVTVINRTMKQELRRAVGLPELPLTVSEAIAHVSPDAEVVTVTSAKTPDRVVLAFSGDGEQSIQLNGEISVNSAVTDVTGQTRAKRPPMFRPVVESELKTAISESPFTINELIRKGLGSL